MQDVECPPLQGNVKAIVIFLAWKRGKWISDPPTFEKAYGDLFNDFRPHRTWGDQSVCMVSHTTAIAEEFERVGGKYDVMFAKLAFVHRYVRDGIEEGVSSLMRGRTWPRSRGPRTKLAKISYLAASAPENPQVPINSLLLQK